MPRLSLFALCVGLSLCFVSTRAEAQSGTRTAPAGAGGIANFQSIGSSVSSGSTSSASSLTGLGIGVGVGGGRASKPFSGLQATPALSPYTRLFNRGIAGSTSVDNYNTLVAPRLSQQAQARSSNQSINRRSREEQLQRFRTNQRVQAIAAQNAIPVQGSENIFPTGHSTAFGFYSRYYPSLNGRRR